MSRWIPLFALLMIGCPRQVPPVDAGQEPPAWIALDRSDLVRLRRTVERKLAILSTRDDAGAEPSRQRLGAALALIDALQRPPEAPPRDQEHAALKAWASYLDAVLHAESTPPAPEGVEDATRLDALARASEDAAAGRWEVALEAGEEARGSLDAAGVTSIPLLEILARWALQADQPQRAADLLAEARTLTARAAQDAPRLAILQGDAITAALGPGAAALLRARELRSAGDLSGAADAYQEVLAAEEIEEPARATVRSELDELLVTAGARADELMARVDVLLSGRGPYDHAAALLQEVEALPEAAVQDEELLRLRAWLRGLDSGAGQVEAGRAALEAIFQEGKDRVASGRYREALARFDRLEGTPLQAQGRQARRAAVDELVRAERERAGRQFVAARKKRGDARAAALEEVRALLAGLLDEFPSSSYADRVEANLSAVEREMGR